MPQESGEDEEGDVVEEGAEQCPHVGAGVHAENIREKGCDDQHGQLGNGVYHQITGQRVLHGNEYLKRRKVKIEKDFRPFTFHFSPVLFYFSLEWR